MIKSKKIVSGEQILKEQDYWSINELNAIQKRNNYYKTPDTVMEDYIKTYGYELPVVECEWIREKGGWYKLIIKCPYCGMFHKHCAEEAVLFYNLTTNTDTDILRVSHCDTEGGRNIEIEEPYKNRKGILSYRILANPNNVKSVNNEFVIYTLNEKIKKERNRNE